MAYWKAAGLSYLQYVGVATTALRSAVKPTVVSRYLVKEDVHYKKQTWANSKPGEKTYFTGSMTKAVQGYENSLGHLSPDAIPSKVK